MVARVVFSVQYSVFRRFAPKVQSLKLSMRVLKQVYCLLLAFLNTEYWTLNTSQARDLGTHGVIYVVEELDPIALIQQKLKRMEESGELAQRNAALQKKARTSVERPKPIGGITRAIKPRVFYFDPTYEAKEDLYDHQARQFAKKGMMTNPLETISLSHNLLFFNGDDLEQLAWVKKQLTKAIETKPLKLILVRGAPLKLTEELSVPVYFDQTGVLTKKLGIHHVPAIVSQEGLHLRIEEVVLSPSRELKTEGDL